MIEQILMTSHGDAVARPVGIKIPSTLPPTGRLTGHIHNRPVNR
jgi:hypothetical protein